MVRTLVSVESSPPVPVALDEEVDALVPPAAPCGAARRTPPQVPPPKPPLKGVALGLRDDVVEPKVEVVVLAPVVLVAVDREEDNVPALYCRVGRVGLVLG